MFFINPWAPPYNTHKQQKKAAVFSTGTCCGLYIPYYFPIHSPLSLNPHLLFSWNSFFFTSSLRVLHHYKDSQNLITSGVSPPEHSHWLMTMLGRKGIKAKGFFSIQQHGKLHQNVGNNFLRSPQGSMSICDGQTEVAALDGLIQMTSLYC